MRFNLEGNRMPLTANNLRATIEQRTNRPFQALAQQGPSSRSLIANAANHDNFQGFLFMLNPNSEPLRGDENVHVPNVVERRFSPELHKNVLKMTQLRLLKDSA